MELGEMGCVECLVSEYSIDGEHLRRLESLQSTGLVMLISHFNFIIYPQCSKSMSKLI